MCIRDRLYDTVKPVYIITLSLAVILGISNKEPEIPLDVCPYPVKQTTNSNSVDIIRILLLLLVAILYSVF